MAGPNNSLEKDLESGVRETSDDDLAEFERLINTRYEPVETQPDNPMVIRNRFHNPKILENERIVFTEVSHDKQLEEETGQRLTVDEGEQSRFVDLLESTMNKSSEFMVHDLAPLELGISNSILDAEETLQALTGDSEVKFGNTNKLRNLLTKAVDIKFIDFICQQFELDEESREKLINTVFQDGGSGVLEALRQQVGNNG